MQVAILGLGKMGRNLAEKLMKEGHHVVIWNRSRTVLDEMRQQQTAYVVSGQLTLAHTLEELRDSLQKPRLIWAMLPAGEATESVMTQLLENVVEQNDVVIDGGNSFYKDTERRAQQFQQKLVKYLGIGVSGGVIGLNNGYPLMVGGDQTAYEYVKPVLDSLAKPNGTHTYFGKGGAGHFVKMVHNGIEYGMMQAVAEGFGVLAKSDYKPDLVRVGNTWQKGSIVSSFLVWMAENAISKDPNLAQFDGYIEATGEGKWTSEVAKELKVPTPVLDAAIEFRNRSQYDKGVQETYVAKLVAALRHEFGGHEIHKDDPFAEESGNPQTQPS